MSSFTTSLWPLRKYARWNYGGWNENEVLQTSSQHPLIICVNIGELVIKQGSTIVDVVDLTLGPTQIKGISKGDQFCIFVKYGEFYRKFRVKFSNNNRKNAAENCLECVKKLQVFFYTTKIEDQFFNFSDLYEEFSGTEPINWLNEVNFKVPEHHCWLPIDSCQGLQESVTAAILDPGIYDTCRKIKNALKFIEGK